jgi:hypothetical protein
MKAAVALGALALAYLAGSGATAAARPAPTISCRYDKTLVPGESGPVRHLRIRQTAPRVDDYLSRCQVASFVAGTASVGIGAYHATFHLMGARWFIGSFRCTYRYHGDRRPDETVVATRCEHRGKYASVVWFDAYV